MKTKKKERYANHAPGELGRLLEELMDAFENETEQDKPERKEEENGNAEDEDRTNHREPEQQQTIKHRSKAQTAMMKGEKHAK